jgi:heme-degrading monooxygenase HmoA
MYGTIARLKVKPGKEAELRARQDKFNDLKIPGAIETHVYRMDADPNELYLVVVFDSKESYLANAQSPGQHERYLDLLTLLDGEPEWHDGEIISSYRYNS